ncbi:Kynurenine formamidase [Sphingobium faniae]|nr:Kynurenine formamidase [Sphingobium faniae]
MTVAWGKWGEEDERGALNHIQPEQVRAAAALVREGVVISLAQPLFPGMMMPEHRPGLMHFMDRDGGDYAAGARAPGGFKFSEDSVVMPLHVGTHIDALCHCWYGDELYNGFPANEIRSTRGASRCGVDKISPIFTRGILLDFVHLEGQPLADGDSIGLDRVKAALDHAGTDVKAGDAVLLRTGWLERQRNGDKPDYNREPGIDLEAAEYLAVNGAAVIGADNFAVEVLPFVPGTIFPVHQLLIRDFGIPLMEGLVLAQLAQHGRGDFLFSTAPLPVRGGTGSPIVPVAVL